MKNVEEVENLPRITSAGFGNNICIYYKDIGGIYSKHNIANACFLNYFSINKKKGGFPLLKVSKESGEEYQQVLWGSGGEEIRMSAAIGVIDATIGSSRCSDDLVRELCAAFL